MTDKELFWKIVDITNGSLTSDKAENEAVKLINDYASTKAEEEAKAFAVFVMQPYTTDPFKPEDFKDRYNQYKQQ